MTHATGYPVYLLVSRVFALLPLGGLAYRVNLFTAVMAALALGLVYLNGRLLGGWRVAALGSALALGVCQVFWWQAVIAELYAIAAALVAGIFCLVLLWRQTGDQRLLFAAGLLGGLSLGIHLTVALAAPGILLYLVLSARSRPAWVAALAGAALGTVLAFGAFLFIDALDAPSTYYNTTLRHGLSAWGLSAGDVDSPLERLAFLFGARQFQMFLFDDPYAQRPDGADYYWKTLTAMFAPGVVGLMGVGFAAALVRRWREGLLLLAIWLGMLGFVVNYSIGDIEPFYIPSFTVLAIAAAVGAAAVLDGVQWAARRLALARPWQAGLAAAAGLLLLAVMLQPKTALVSAGWQAGQITFLEPDSWESQYPYPVRFPEAPHNYAAYILSRIEDNAIVFTSWDRLYPYYFVAHVEQRRLGLAFHEEFVQDGLVGTAASTRAYIDLNLGQRPVYFDHRPPDDIFRLYVVNRVFYVPGGYQVVRRK
jgi:4-amino-4-deoxy-L-arabinose transferase-like glycosyltransferase